MTNFGQIGITEAQIDLLEVAQKFCRDNSPMEKVRALIEDEMGYDEALWAQMVNLGWLGIAVPEAYGGVGLSLTEIVPVAEQMGRYMMHSPFLSTSLAAQAILAAGTQAQKQAILPEIIGGAAATLAVSELHGDWDLDNVKASAAKHEGGYILSGEKIFVADLASAKWVIVSAKIDDETRLIIVPRENIDAANMRREALIDETKRSYGLTLDGLIIDAAMTMDRE